MTASTVFQLINQLSRQEQAALRKVVRSPYFNSREEVARLADYLLDNIGRKEDRLGRLPVSKHVFPDRPDVPEENLNRVASALSDTIRLWLSIEEMRADANQSQVYLQLAYKRRGMTEFREKALPQAIAENNRQPLRDLQYHYRQCVLNWDRFDHAARVKWQNSTEFQGMTEQQAYYLLTKIIKLGCLGMSFEARIGQRYDMLFLDEAVRHVEEKNLMHIPAIRTFYHVYKCLRNEDSTLHARHIREMLTENNGQFSNSDLQFITSSLTSYLSLQYEQTDNSAFLQDSFDLFKTALANGILTPNRVLSKYTYHEVASTALTLGDLDWAREFIDGYKEFLPNADRENTWQFHLAIWHFRRKDFDEAVRLLQKIMLRDEIMYNLEARGIMVAILYETGARDSATWHLDSFKTFMRRHPEAGKYREPHLNFIRLTHKLLKTNLQQLADREALKNEIRESKNLKEKKWLLEMVEK